MDIKIKLPERYLEEEERCGYTVTSKMKKVWAVELDLLAELERICKKYNLKYCVAAGTLLGAVRHKGFIPWDDDIDVYMLRDDYDRLMQLSGEFSYPYFLQNTITEPNLFRTHAQIRNSSTTGFIENDRYMNINKGIFIDIFPLDGVNENKGFQTTKQKCLNYFYKKCLSKYNTAYIIRNGQDLEDKLKAGIKKILFKIIRKKWLFRRFENNLKRFSKEKTELWGNRTLVFDCPKSKRPLEDWKHIKYTEFEFLTVPIPENYDEILKQQYGNYMEFPKDKKNGSMHGGLILSVECAYSEYEEETL